LKLAVGLKKCGGRNKAKSSFGLSNQVSSFCINTHVIFFVKSKFKIEITKVIKNTLSTV